MRLSDKTIVNQDFDGSYSIPSDFNSPEVIATIRDKGVNAIYEKCYFCPCKGKTDTHKSTCRNCGGTGWMFCNPTKTKFIITGIQHDSKLKEAALQEYGQVEMGTVNVTATNDNKLSYMDRIILTDATAEHTQIVYVNESDDESQMFAYTKYDIKSIDYIATFTDVSEPIQRLIEGTDYTYQNNILKFTGLNRDAAVTIRYVHNPVFHVISILRESFTSYKGANPTSGQKLILPVKVIAKRAHLIADVENFDGNRLFNNSWLPGSCETEEISSFQRQVQYSNVIDIYNLMTQAQKDALMVHLGI